MVHNSFDMSSWIFLGYGLNGDSLFLSGSYSGASAHIINDFQKWINILQGNIGDYIYIIKT